MMEIKVQCDCGQRYKFDVEPANGRMPYTVACPLCGADGTSKATNLIQERLGLAPPSATLASPAVVPSPDVAPSPVITVAAPSPPARVYVPTGSPPPAPTAAPLPGVVPAVAGAPSRLRINRTEAPEETEPSGAIPDVAPVASAPTKPAGKVRRPAAVTGDKAAPQKSFGLSLAGAAAGTVLGAAIYFCIFNYAGFRLKLLAVAVGFLAGLGTRLIGKEGSKELGMITAALALAGIVGAQYLVALNWVKEDFGVGKMIYGGLVENAKEVIKEVPTGSDEEIRAYLAKMAVADGEKPEPAAVSSKAVTEFREKSLPELRDLASGRLTQAEFEKRMHSAIAKNKEETAEDPEDSVKGILLLLLLSKGNILSMAAAAALAFKMSSDA